MSITRTIVSGALVVCLLSTSVMAQVVRYRHLQGADLRQLEYHLTRYFNANGSYPDTSSRQTWFEQLVAHDSSVLSALRFGVTPNGEYPIDYYGYPLVYEPPSAANNMQVVLRSVGENGIDDGGAGDDWDIRYGARLGYWHKAAWPTAFWRAATALLLFVIGWAALARYVRSKAVRYPVVAIWFGLLAILLVSAGHFPVADHDPWWFGHIAMLGQLVLSCGAWTLIIFLVMTLVDRRRRGRHAKWGLCKKCGYDLRGTRKAGRRSCPECGEPFVVASDNIDLPEAFDS